MKEVWQDVFRETVATLRGVGCLAAILLTFVVVVNGLLWLVELAPWLNYVFAGMVIMGILLTIGAVLSNP